MPAGAPRYAGSNRSARVSGERGLVGGDPRNGRPNVILRPRHSAATADSVSVPIPATPPPDGWPLALSPRRPSTLALWFRAASSQSVQHIFGRRLSCGAENYQLARDPQNLLHFGTHLLPLTTGADIVPLEWTHFAASYDGCTLRLYLNGTLASVVQPFEYRQADLVADLLFGSSGTCPGTFDGWIDDVLIYSAALSPLEIAATARRFPGSASPTADLELHTGVNAAPSFAYSRTIAAGASLNLSMVGPSLRFLGHPLTLGIDVLSLSRYGDGVSIPDPLPFIPGLWLGPGSLLLLDGLSIPCWSLASITPSGATFSMSSPPALAGLSVMMQALVPIGPPPTCSLPLGLFASNGCLLQF